MRRPIEVPAVLAVLAIGLGGCTAEREPDWLVLEEEAAAFVQTMTVRGDAHGAGSFRIDAADPSASEDPSVSEGDGWNLSLGYDEPVRLEAVTVSCFGEGTATVGYMTRAGSSWVGGDDVELACGGVPRTVEIPAEFGPVDEIVFDAALTDGAGGIVAAAVTRALE